uniref:Cytochrome b ascorbate-dependent protein 3 n=1 Tax=Schistocephalus solidus TaxID=70667 RepID=A0A0X3PY42_SCHSO
MANQGVQFWAIFALSQALAITIFVLAIYWRGNFFNGFDYSNTGNLINFHAVFMVIGFVLFFGESILCFRVLTVLPKLPVKILHGVFHACNFCLSVAGLAAIFEFYRRILRPGMYSLHSWIGIFAVALYTLQVFCQGIFHLDRKALRHSLDSG